MQEDVRQHAQRPVARRVVVLVAEDGSVDLGLCRILQTFDLSLAFAGMSVFSDWTSSLTPPSLRPAVRPVFAVLPFVFSQACNLFSSIPRRVERALDLPSRAARRILRRQKCSRIVELAGLSLRPLIEPRNIHHDLSVRRQFHIGAIHGTRCRSLKVDAFAVVATAVAGTLEFVLAGFQSGVQPRWVQRA